VEPGIELCHRDRALPSDTVGTGPRGLLFLLHGRVRGVALPRRTSAPADQPRVAALLHPQDGLRGRGPPPVEMGRDRSRIIVRSLKYSPSQGRWRGP
jgi:hypothetical protein